MKENTDEDWRWSVLQLRIIIERITFPSTIIEFGEGVFHKCGTMNGWY